METGFSKHGSMPRVNIETYFFFFSLDALVYFSSLVAVVSTSKTMLSNSGKVEWL